MADIDIQRKESAAWIWWLLAALLVGFLIYWLLSSSGEDRLGMTEDTVSAPMAAAPEEPAAPLATGEMEAYFRTCAERQPGEMGLDHEHTSSCIRQLIGSLRSVVPEDRLRADGVGANLERASEAADELAASPQDVTRHSQVTRDAFDAITDAVEDLQSDFPGVEGSVEQMSEATEAIDVEGPLLDQRAEVQRFFSHAGEALRQMSGASTSARM